MIDTNLWSCMKAKLPNGVQRFDLKDNQDDRGNLTELFRRDWGLPECRQINLVCSKANVVRGVHVHPNHSDYLLVLEGELLLGMQDLRRASETFGLAATATLSADNPTAWFIPGGVAHGFYTPTATKYLYGLTNEWEAGDDFGCCWDDPGLAIVWPELEAPILSERDMNAPSLDSVMQKLDSLSKDPN